MKRAKQLTAERLHVAYVRVSTDEQGNSVEAQQVKLEAMATVKDIKLSTTITDEAESAKNLNRPGVKRLIEMVKAGQVATIMVCKLDRLTRSIGDLDMLMKLVEKHSVSLISLGENIDTSTATGRAMVNMIGTFSQWERETIIERVKDTLRHKRSKGERMGNVPYGYAAEKNTRNEAGLTLVAGTLVMNPAEQAVIAQIKALRDAGESLQSIADSLNAAGLATRKGTAWRYEYVNAILKQKEVKLAA